MKSISNYFRKSHHTVYGIFLIVFFFFSQSYSSPLVFSKLDTLKVDGEPIENFFFPSPALADWDQDGDLDLIAGIFKNRSVLYFENIGSKKKPELKAHEFLKAGDEVIKLSYD